MSRALRRRVPLNAMCSSRCATPLCSAGSLRVPTPAQTPSDVVSTESIRSVATRNPFGRVVTRTVSAAEKFIQLFRSLRLWDKT